MSDKFSIIYSFKIHENKQEEFIHYWTELTNLIYKFEGSYGSTLHQANENLFIAYAQWPDKKTFDQSLEINYLKVQMILEKRCVYAVPRLKKNMN